MAWQEWVLLESLVVTPVLALWLRVLSVVWLVMAPTMSSSIEEDAMMFLINAGACAIGVGIGRAVRKSDVWANF